MIGGRACPLHRAYLGRRDIRVLLADNFGGCFMEERWILKLEYTHENEGRFPLLTGFSYRSYCFVGARRIFIYIY